MKKYWILFIFLVFGCNDGIISPFGKFDEPFWLRIDGKKTVLPDQLSVEFKDVPGDSRCPLNVVCVWEGEVAVQLLVDHESFDPATLELKLRGDTAREDTLQHSTLDTLGYRFTLMEVAPYPVDPGVIERREYRALLKVAKSEE
jgi:hypothetical protein